VLTTQATPAVRLTHVTVSSVARTPEENDFVADYFQVIVKLNAIQLPSSVPIDQPLRTDQLTQKTIKLNELIIKPDNFDGHKPRPRK
jgi:hypothetical protein